MPKEMPVSFSSLTVILLKDDDITRYLGVRRSYNPVQKYDTLTGYAVNRKDILLCVVHPAGSHQ